MEARVSRRVRYTLAICRSLELARAVFAAAIAEKPADRFMIRNRIRIGFLLSVVRLARPCTVLPRFF